LNSVVYALAVSGSDLYVGGDFTQTGDGALTDLGYIARYDMTWHALPNQGLYSSVTPGVQALAVDGGDLYVGGGFTQTGDGALTNLNRIARYETRGNTWHALPHQGLSDTVWALAKDGSDLYVGGYLTHTGDGTLTDLGRIARYDTAASTWHVLPNQGLGAGGAGVCRVKALAVHGGDVYVGGDFSHTADGMAADLGGIARYGIPVVSEPGAYLPLVVR